MEPLKAVIIDDESRAIAMLSALLERSSESIEICASFQDPRQALEFKEWHNINVLFIDVRMPFMNAFEFLESLGPIPASIIFTTAYEEHAMAALKMGAEDYLLKPVQQSELNKVLTRIANELRKREASKSKHPISKICIPNSDGFQVLELERLVWLEGSNNYTYMHLQDDSKPILISRTLMSFEKKLRNTTFIRINKSVIVNADFIDVFSKRNGNSAILKSGKEFSISPVYRERFIKAFEHLML